MTINEFKKIICYLQKNYACPKCKGQPHHEYIDLVGSTPLESTFFIDCPRCNIYSFLTVVHILTPPQEEKTQFFPRRFNNNQHYDPVSKDEILDMHNFLKNHQGDISPYLK